MSVTKIEIGEPFFSLQLIENEANTPVNSKSIVVNLSDNPITIENQKIAEFQSNYALNTGETCFNKMYRMVMPR